jgi:hypothetical protein
MKWRRAIPALFFTAACAVGWCATTGPLPPTPPKAKLRHRAVTQTTQGAGALALLAKPKIVLPPTKTLSWAWSPSDGNGWSNITFLVCSNNTLTVPRSNWPIIALSLTNSFSITVNPSVPAAFFTVVSSNTVTGLVSE